jgi:hypothetical protein
MTSKSKGFIYYLGYTSVLSLKSVKQRDLKILSGQYITMSSLTFDLLTSKSVGFMCYLGQIKKCCVSANVVKKKNRVGRSKIIFLKILFPIQNLFGFIYYLGCTNVLSFMSIKQRVLKILSGQYIHMSSLTLDL